MLFVNFKAYEAGTGANAIELISLLEQIARQTSVKVIVCLQATDIKEASQLSTLEIWAQHVDSIEHGAHTGSILAEAVFEDGAIGTLLNHSEHKFENFDELATAHRRARSVGLKTLIFAQDSDELEAVLQLAPDFVSYEPPELVGSKTTSVAKAKPEAIKKAAELARKEGVPLVVGAGIKSQDDVRTSMALGASGVLVASDIVTSKDPKKEVLDLVGGF